MNPNEQLWAQTAEYSVSNCQILIQNGHFCRKRSLQPIKFLFRAENRARRSYNKGLERFLSTRSTYSDDFLPKITQVSFSTFLIENWCFFAAEDSEILLALNCLIVDGACSCQKSVKKDEKRDIMMIEVK